MVCLSEFLQGNLLYNQGDIHRHASTIRPSLDTKKKVSCLPGGNNNKKNSQSGGQEMSFFFLITIVIGMNRCNIDSQKIKTSKLN